MNALFAYEAEFWFNLIENHNQQFYDIPYSIEFDEPIDLECLFEPREMFIWPCSFNPINCGNTVGDYLRKITLIGFNMDRE